MADRVVQTIAIGDVRRVEQTSAHPGRLPIEFPFVPSADSHPVPVGKIELGELETNPRRSAGDEDVHVVGTSQFVQRTADADAARLSSIRVISADAPSRIGGPQYPVPRDT
jgi:hypothetical protein